MSTTIYNSGEAHRINWDFVSRLFIGLLFIISGIMKVMHFEEIVLSLNDIQISPSLSPIILTFAILIEIVVATLYIKGGKWKDANGYTLIAFVAIVTVIMHNNFGDPAQATHALKNLAISGGILATLNGVHRRR